MSNIPAECRRLEQRLAAAGLTTRMFCDRLGIKMSTFWRWREGKTEPYVSNWAEAQALVETMVNEVTPKRSKGNGVIAEKPKAADQKAGSAERGRRRPAGRRG